MTSLLVTPQFMLDRVKRAHDKNKEAWRESAYRTTRKHPGKKKIRNTVSHAVRNKVIPPAKQMPCIECGKQALAYDHSSGYSWWMRWAIWPLCREHNAVTLRRPRPKRWCKRGHHQLSGNNVVWRYGARRCRICLNAKNRKLYWKRKNK